MLLLRKCPAFENAEDNLRIKLGTCGVSDDEFEVLDAKIDTASVANLEEIKKTSILRVQEDKI